MPADLPAVLLIVILGESRMIPEYDRSFHSCVLYLMSYAIPHIHVFDVVMVDDSNSAMKP